MVIGVLISAGQAVCCNTTRLAGEGEVPSPCTPPAPASPLDFGHVASLFNAWETTAIAAARRSFQSFMPRSSMVEGAR
jgi:hypothetical protein